MYIIGENLNFDITEIGLLYFLIQFNVMFAEEVKIFCRAGNSGFVITESFSTGET
mgnify:CR=1 FL=1